MRLQVPYRIDYRWQLHKWQKITSSIWETEPIRVIGGNCTICTQLRHNDVQMYLVAIKSLLRWGVATRVAVFDDGDLTKDDLRKLEVHLSGVEIYPRQITDHHPSWSKVSAPVMKVRNYYSSYRFTTNVIAFVETPKCIHMDADIVWQKKPDELLRWIEVGENGIAMHVPQKPLARVSSDKPHIQEIFRRAVPDLNTVLGFDGNIEDGLVGCLMGYEKHQLSFSLLESIATASEKISLPIQNWGGQQVVMNYMLSLSGYNLLPSFSYINFWPNFEKYISAAKAIHFIGSRRFVDGIYAKVALQTINELMDSTPRM